MCAQWWIDVGLSTYGSSHLFPRRRGSRSPDTEPSRLCTSRSGSSPCRTCFRTPTLRLTPRSQSTSPPLLPPQTGEMSLNTGCDSQRWIPVTLADFRGLSLCVSLPVKVKWYLLSTHQPSHLIWSSRLSYVQD